MNRELTAPTRPRMSSGVASWTSEMRITTLTMSAAPITAKSPIDSQIECDSANTMVARPKRSPPGTSHADPAVDRWASTASSAAPTAGRRAQHAEAPRPGMKYVACVDRNSA